MARAFGFLGRYLPDVLSVFASVIFLNSLRYKFTDAPETQEIFGRLNDWATSWGAPGLFAKSGLFSQYMIGSAELVASFLLLIGILPWFKRLQALGALVSFAVMSGAVNFHLFTPLGIDPNNDGGGLFMAAVIIWVSSLWLVIIKRRALLELGCGVWRAMVGR